jgi:hypothetical protein
MLFAPAVTPVRDLQKKAAFAKLHELLPAKDGTPPPTQASKASAGKAGATIAAAGERVGAAGLLARRQAAACWPWPRCMGQQNSLCV